jgi:hypothetical protein
LNTLEYITTKFKIINDSKSTLKLLLWKQQSHISSFKTVNFEQTNKMTTGQLTYGYKFCWFTPCGLLPSYRHGIFNNPTSRDGIKSRFPTNISLKIPNPTWILGASRHPAKPVQAPHSKCVIFTAWAPPLNLPVHE